MPYTKDKLIIDEITCIDTKVSIDDLIEPKTINPNIEFYYSQWIQKPCCATCRFPFEYLLGGRGCGNPENYKLPYVEEHPTPRIIENDYCCPHYRH